MFPIKAEQLTLMEIADYWARETKPRATQAELLTILEKAWFGGELMSLGRPTGLDLLRAMYKSTQDDIVFLIGAIPGPPEVQDIEDGGALVDPRLRVKVPSSNPDNWTMENCSEALATIAEEWGEEKMPSIIVPLIRSIPVTRSDFATWVADQGYDMPKFWGHAADLIIAEPTRDTQNAVAADPIIAQRKPKLAADFFINLIKETYWDGRDEGKMPSAAQVQKLAIEKGLRGARKGISAALLQLKQKAGIHPGAGRPKKISAKIISQK
jgi:hypothetical protein